MLKTLKSMLLGGKPARERRQLPPPGPCPNIGASLVKDTVVMRVSEPVSEEFWNWLVLSGWREVRMTKNRRKYTRIPASAFGKLARVSSREREVLWARMLSAVEKST
jgi:hypothetical protein